MATRVSAVNAALRNIGANLIADPDEDSESARQAKSAFNAVVASEIQGYPWFFAKAQAQLAEAAEPPLFKFAHKYTLPSDFLRLVELEDQWVFSPFHPAGDNSPAAFYELQGRDILTDLQAPLRLTYIRDLSDFPAMWPPLFADVVSTALSVALAMPLTKSDGMVKLASALYDKAVARAKKSNAIQQPPRHRADGSWVAARRV